MVKDLIKRDYHSLIFEFRGYKVMIDSDLASLYEVDTKVLKQQVKRNIDRFPEDFMFELTKSEKHQLVMSCERLENIRFSKVMPLVFTEQGVAMLSSVIKSNKAISMNIEIMRAFVRFRVILGQNSSLRKEIENLDDKINKVFKYLLERIDSLQEKHTKREVKPVGYKTYEE